MTKPITDAEIEATIPEATFVSMKPELAAFFKEAMADLRAVEQAIKRAKEPS